MDTRVDSLRIRSYRPDAEIKQAAQKARRQERVRKEVWTE
jgi:hypothetical protein